MSNEINLFESLTGLVLDSIISSKKLYESINSM